MWAREGGNFPCLSLALASLFAASKVFFFFAQGPTKCKDCGPLPTYMSLDTDRTLHVPSRYGSYTTRGIGRNSLGLAGGPDVQMMCRCRQRCNIITIATTDHLTTYLVLAC